MNTIFNSLICNCQHVPLDTKIAKVCIAMPSVTVVPYLEILELLGKQGDTFKHVAMCSLLSALGDH